MSVDVALDNIRIKELPTINLGGGVDLDLDNIRIKELPTIDIDLDADLGLDNIRLTELAPINVGITSLPLIRLDTIRLETDSKVDLGLDNVKVDLGLDNIRIRELPQLDFQFGLRPMRFHFPLSYKFCLTLFGCRIVQFETCGEGMIVAEDYVAHKTETCD
ncbi:hypothetical protein BTA51_27340 [Hahella sp. CCB-MM4]|uniref:hypothetical protein n=1 Tax=Hahella sp. (strain CCB-MM4) TaxID=1926491 RepID=UPI000B9B61E0|nr:hypothetical protein [Hahella sp. CCB-MM4]OZG70189.1 hypothetical protein BTA51_27340 [Hahella sp. CCB-MM4]